MNNDDVTKNLEKLNKIYGAYTKEYFKYTPTHPIYKPILYRNPGILVTTSQGCEHAMQEYIGLTRSFKFCTKCDHKESL